MSLFGDKERHLTKREIDLIKSVFRTANLPPLEDLVITNGLSLADTPFTDSDHRINVGPVLFGHDLSSGEDAETFVHEMTHAWQYHNETLSRTHGAKAQILAYGKDSVVTGAQFLGAAATHQPAPDPSRHYVNKLYSYDTDGTWEEMGFEGQANIVEHWYKSRMKEDGYEYLFIKYLVWGYDPTISRLEGRTGKDLAEIEARRFNPSPLEHSSSSVSYQTRPPLTDTFLVSLLKPRFGSKDVPGFGRREKRLESVFSSVNVSEGIRLYTRLVLQNRKDPVAVYFHDHLSTTTRRNLLRILQSRLTTKKS